MTKDEALKLALEALEDWDNWSDHTPPKTTDAITAIKEALAQTAQPEQEPVATVIKCGVNRTWMSEALGQLPDGTYSLYTAPPKRQPLTDEQVNLFINGRGDEDDEDYVEPTGDGFGLTDADLVRLVRRVEAAHDIKENT